MIKQKLSNVITRVEDHMRDYPEAYYRLGDKSSLYPSAGLRVGDNDDSASSINCSLDFSGKIDFLTYFNACSVKKWHQYTGISDFKLHLELSGDVCTIQFIGISEGENAPTALSEGYRLVNGKESEAEAGESYFVFELELPKTDKDLVGFILQTHGAVTLHKAFYFVEVEENAVNPVKAAIVTTTFKKEQYIIPNINLVKRELFSSEGLASVFHMFVIDNGQTLDSALLNDDNVTIVPNENVGGSGGFARGMMETLSRKDDFTHVFLMDDDIKISTEAIKRTYYLLALAQGKYREAFINGGMIATEQPNLLYEDISYVLKSGVHHRLKGNLYIDQVSDVVKNEAISVEVSGAFGGWWFSCIPVSTIKKVGLPFPFFVRVDDVEYAIRSNPVYMTLNGICVWHEGFEGRFRPSVDVYQYSRNFFIMIALDDCASEALYFRRWERNVHLFLRTMEYDTVDLFLDALEDYLRGPDFIAHANGEEIMKRNSAKNEKFTSLTELEGVLSGSSLYGYSDKISAQEPGRFLRIWRTLPYDRHLLPDFALREKPALMKRGRLAPFSPNAVGTKTLVVVEEDGRQASIRHMDKQRYNGIKVRLKRLKKEYKERGHEVRAAYRAAKPWLTSWDFWNEYLGTDLKMKASN